MFQISRWLKWIVRSLGLHRCLTGRAFFVLAMVVGATGLRGQTTLVWGPNGARFPAGGDGIWSTGVADWTPDFGVAYQVWPAPVTNPNDPSYGPYGPAAVFGGTAGTVTLGSAISASDLTFNTSGYVINGGGNALTLTNEYGGTSPNVFVNGAATTATINAPLAGTSGLTVNGGGTLVLGGANILTGGVYVLHSGLTVLSATGSLASSNSLTFGINRDSSVTGGGGSFTLDNTGATGATGQTLGYVNLYGGEATVQSLRVAAQNLTLTFAGEGRTIGGTVNFVVSGGVNGASNRINLGGQASGWVNQSSFFNGSDYAWKDGGGYLRAINYGVDGSTVTTSGATSVSGTHVQLTSNVTAQTSATFSTLKLVGTSSLALADGQTLTVSGILKTGGGAATISGGAAVQPSSQDQLVIRTDAADDSLTISTAVSTNDTGYLTKTGAGTLTLSGTNTYNGGTYLNAGTLSVPTLPAGADSSPLGMGPVSFSGGTLQYTGGTLSTTRTFRALSGGGGIEVTQAGTTLTIASALNGSNTGLVSDALVKTGAGTLVLGGGDDNSGLVLAVNAGTVQLAKSSSYFTHAVNLLLVNNGGTVQLAGSGGNQIYDNNSVTVNTGGTLDLNGTSETFNGLVGGGSVLNNSTSASATLTLGGYSVPTVYTVFSGTISDGTGGQTVALVKTAAGTQVLSGTNTYTGGTTISAGTLQIGAGGTTGSVAGNIENDAALVFNRSDRLIYAGAISGNGTVTQNGTGTLTLTGSNSVSGTTTINAGTLEAAATGTKKALGGTTAITINLGGTLLTSTANQIKTTAAVTLAGGTLNTANTVQTVGALTLAASSSLDLGNGNTSKMTFGTSSGQSWASAAAFSILNYDGKVYDVNSGTQAGTAGDAVFFGNKATSLSASQLAQIQFVNPAGYSGTFGAYLSGNGQLLAAVPEPATWLAGALTVLLGVSAWYRQSRMVSALRALL